MKRRLEPFRIQAARVLHSWPPGPAILFDNRIHRMRPHLDQPAFSRVRWLLPRPPMMQPSFIDGRENFNK
jgi:hypothetical protein